MRTLVLGLFGVTAVAILVNTSWAKEQKGPAGDRAKQIIERLKAADTNEDGKLSKEEAPERLKQHFERIDANNDGQLEPAELKRAMAHIAAHRRQQSPGGPRFLERLKAADTDKDGKLSKSEALEAVGKMFDRIDANDDGHIDKTELQDVIARRARAQRGGPAGQGPRPGAIVERLKAADKDKDGKLTKEEAPPKLKERFDQVDANGDGVIDKAEVERVLKHLQKRRGA